jgi:hypothetical protein
MVNHGGNTSILKLKKSKHRESLTLEPLSIKLTQLPIEQLTTSQVKLFHILIFYHRGDLNHTLKAKLKNGMMIYFGMLDQLRPTEMELQNNIMTKLNMRKIIKLGKKHGIRK